MTDLALIENKTPETVTVACPLKGFQQRYVIKGCMNCEYYKGIAMLTDAIEMPINDPVTKMAKGMRPIHWHEKFMIRCACPTTRRCANMAIAED